MSSRSGLLKQVGIYVVYPLGLLLLAIVVAELLILPHGYSPVPRSVQLCGFHAAPGEVVDEITINALGFTGDSMGPAKPAGTTRILTLGGSVLFNRRMTERLAAGLRAGSEQPLEVLGAALRSHTTMSSLLKYRALSAYRFDYVLIHHGINDLWANNVAREDFDHAYSHLGPWYVRNGLLDRSLIARLAYNKFLYEGWAPYLSPTLRDAGFDNAAGFAAEHTFRRNIAELVEAVRVDGGEPILMTFAWSVPDHYDYAAFEAGEVGYNNPADYNPCPVELWGSLGHVREGLDRHNRALRQIAAEYHVRLIDLETAIGKDLVWFGDPVHLSEEGTDELVRIVSRYFVENDLLR